MSKSVRCALICIFLFCQISVAGILTDIYYDTQDLGGGRWEYTYTVENKDLIPPIEEFTIWFDVGLYDNLVVTTPSSPPEWDQIVWQVEPVLNDPGGYDALANATNVTIDIGETLSGFSVSFGWLGTMGDPGEQLYDIIDPTDFSVIESGVTLPEPATLFLLGFGGLGLLRRRR